MKKCLLMCFVFFVLLGLARAQGSFTLWDESINGSFSNDIYNPTSLDPVMPGTCTVIGSSQQSGSGSIGDYFTITVPQGSRISSINLSRDNKLFVWIGDTDYTTPAGYSSDAQNGSLFPQIGVSQINAGTYGVEIFNNNFQPGSSIANYQLDFFVTVPEPSTVALGSIGLLGLLAFRRSRIRDNR